VTGPIIGRGRSATAVFLAAAASLAIGLGLLALGLWAAGYDPIRALGALWNGAFGSWYAITSGTLVRSVPLILIGLGITLAFRAGAFNIGADGQFYAGAIAATWVGVHLTGLPSFIAIPVLLLAATIAGALWVAVPVWLRQRYGVWEVISTLLLNFVAESLVSYMVQGPLQESQHIYPQSAAIAQSAQLPFLGGTRLHLGFVLSIVLGLVLALVLGRTLWGFRLRAVGAGPRAAEISGRVMSGRMIAVALLWSGAIAGLAGGVELSGVSYALYQNLSPGYGFTAIAVALLARLRPLGVIAAGILFGALEAGASAMQRDAGVPAVTVYVVEAVVILLVLLADMAARRTQARHVVPEPL
jgi:simple sugar transport system permease protein